MIRRFHAYVTGFPNVMVRTCSECGLIAAPIDDIASMTISYLGDVPPWVDALDWRAVHDGLCPAVGGAP